MENSSIYLDFGNETEALLQSVLSKIDDASIDEIEVSRDIDKPKGLVSEPITIAVTITASSVLIIHITRLIERWLEIGRQDRARAALIKASNISNEAVQALKELEMKHADVSISYALSQNKDKQ